MAYKILFVDDEPHILKALVRLFKQESIDVITANSAQAALDIMQSETIPLVISDYQMPGMLGTELLAKIEANWPSTIRIILSGHSDFETVLHAVHSGVVHKFLAKPWNNKELVEHIRTSLAQLNHAHKDVGKQKVDRGLSSINTIEYSASKVQLDVVLDTVFDGIITMSDKGIIVSVNKSVERIFGYQPEELIGEDIACLMPKPYRRQQDYFLSLYHSSDSQDADGNPRSLVGLRKNGEVFPIEISLNSMEINGDLQFLGMIRDISRRVRAESENQLLIDAFEIAQDGFALFSSGGRLLHCNQQFRHLYQACGDALKEGISYKAFFELSIQNGLFVEAQLDPQYWLMHQCEAHQQLPLIKQYELKPGQWIEIHETRAENGSVIASHLDISQLKQTQISLLAAVEQAEHASSARGRFLAMMSHEIRTPLNGVLGLLQLLQDTPLSDAQKGYVDTALISGQSLLTIISDILDFTKIEADKLELISGPCEVSKLCHELLKLFQMRVEEKSIQLTLNLDENLPLLVELDGQRLRQVLLNLVGNGIKFTDVGSVELQVKITPKQRILFEIKDTGIGIPLNEQDQVFSEFSTLSNNADGRIYEGTGLGLAISKKLVELMGGELVFVSTPNLGTVFRFSLPLNELSSKNLPPQTVADTYQFKGTVLLVDDSETNRLVAKLMLESMGVNVVCAFDGFTALECYESNKYELILMDVAMPGIDGLETANRLRQLPEWKDTPIVALTAYAMPDDKKRFKAHGFVGHIEKPLDKKELARAISLYLKAEPTLGGIIIDQGLSEKTRKVIEISALDQLAADTSEEVLPQLVEVFVRDAEQRIKEIGEDNNADILERHLHTLGSSASLYGLKPCAERARFLELQCKQGIDIGSEIESFIMLCQQSLDALIEAVKVR